VTDEQRNEGAEEAIEDLEAPAAAQDDVAGGWCSGKASQICEKPSDFTGCQKPTCKTTEVVIQAI
jgi:hypothetical protein